MNNQTSSIRRFQSQLTNAREAVREFHAAVAQPEMALVVFFCSSDYDLDQLAEEMLRLFSGIQVVGCTTAGEIGPAGHIEKSLTGASFSSRYFKAVSGCITNLQEFSIAAGQNFARHLLQQFEKNVSPKEIDNSFALMLIDGLSVREEPVTRSLQSVLGKIPLIGGSAGDGKRFNQTHVYFNGHFQTDSTVLVLISTPLTFRIFKTHNFVATAERLVVTEAEPTRRLVKEINGRPAAQEYARLLGMETRDLSLEHFATWSFIVLINGESYLRSIQKVNPDDSLTLFCAIENGLVLRIAKSLNLLENLDQTLTRVRKEIGIPQLILGADCIHRKLEACREADKDRIAELYLRNNTTGFSTYGEQFRGVHINQTFVGVAISANLMDEHHA